MNFIYDIVLNFQNELFSFFEWSKHDKIVSIKKIPIICVNDIDFYSFKYNNVIVHQDFIDMIYNKTLYYGSNSGSSISCLITNNKETIGLLFNSDGMVLKKSSLIIDEEDETLEISEMLKKTKINFIKNDVNIKPHNILTRKEQEQDLFLKDFIKNLDKNKQKDLINYIYYDIFERDNSNINDAYEEIKKIVYSNNDCYKNKLFNIVSLITNK